MAGVFLVDVCQPKMAEAKRMTSYNKTGNLIPVVCILAV